MERLVLFLCGVWLWLTRRRRTVRYREVGDTLQSASVYLWSEYANRASTRDRGFMLPDQVEALAILERQSTAAFYTSRRLDSLFECYKFATEELSEPASRSPNYDKAA